MKVEYLKLNRKYRQDLAAFVAKKIADHMLALAQDPVGNEAEINRIMESVLTQEEKEHVRRLLEIYSREETDEESEALLKRSQFHIVP